MSWASLAASDRTPNQRSGGDNAPRAVGKYRVLSELGRGGMANVFLAVAQGTGGVSKLMVLKALLPELAAEPGSLAMFLDEARLAAQLNHGNVVQTYEVGQEGDRHVIVMEYLEGQALAAVIRRAEREGQTFPLALHLRVIISVLEGLHYIHELKGYDGKPLEPVHRDVSPQNVFITYDGRTKVLDFGIAKAASSTTHTVTGTVKGKIAYMSPEQMSGESVDRRTDVYAVGCMLWAAATGRKLWKDVMDAHILRDVTQGSVPTPRSVNPSCDPELERIVMKALAKAPAQRYGSCLELQEELEHYCERIAAPDRPRELGRFVSTLFADTRAELKARVEQALSTVSSGVGFAVPEQSRSVTLNVADTQAQTARTQTISASTLNPQSRPQPVRKRAAWLATPAAALLMLAGYWLVSRAKPDTRAEEPAAATDAARVHAEPNVKMELRSVPGDSKLFLDGQALDGNPVVRMLPSDGKVHQLRAVLDGHQTASAEFTATHDDVVELHLEKLAAPPPPPAPAPKAKARALPAARPSQPARPAAAAGCAQPFYVDSDGIKKVKPGCL